MSHPHEFSLLNLISNSFLQLVTYLKRLIWKRVSLNLCKQRQIRTNFFQIPGKSYFQKSWFINFYFISILIWSIANLINVISLPSNRSPRRERCGIIKEKKLGFFVDVHPWRNQEIGIFARETNRINSQARLGSSAVLGWEKLCTRARRGNLECKYTADATEPFGNLP